VTVWDRLTGTRPTLTVAKYQIVAEQIFHTFLNGECFLKKYTTEAIFTVFGDLDVYVNSVINQSSILV